MLQRIHQTFRVQLLRDVLLPRALDDQVLNTLSSMTFVNNTNVINWLACQQGDLVQALYVVALLCFAATPVVARVAAPDNRWLSGWMRLMAARSCLRKTTNPKLPPTMLSWTP